jgi:hypothetical protein
VPHVHSNIRCQTYFTLNKASGGSILTSPLNLPGINHAFF